MRYSVPSRIAAQFGSNYLKYNDKIQEFTYLCPYCTKNGKTPDTVGHLYVNSVSYKFICHRCGQAGKVGYVSKKSSTYYEEELAPTDIELLIRDSVLVKTDDNTKYKYRIPYNSIFTNPQAYQYMKSRGFTDDEMKYYDIRVGSVFDGPNMSGRVIIPNQVDKLVYTDMYTGRSYVGHDRKYYNAPGANKSEIVFNLHRIPNKSPIVIVEGPLTAIAAGTRAVAIYGKSCSDTQLGMILSKSPSKIYVNLDPDAKEQSDQLCSLIHSKVSVPVYQVITPPGTDAADFSRTEYKEFLRLSSEKEYNPTFQVLINSELIRSQSYTEEGSE